MIEAILNPFGLETTTVLGLPAWLECAIGAVLGIPVGLAYLRWWSDR